MGIFGVVLLALNVLGGEGCYMRMTRFVGWLCMAFLTGLLCTTQRFRDGEGTDDDDEGIYADMFWDKEQLKVVRDVVFWFSVWIILEKILVGIVTEHPKYNP
jgi:hypothetical protein